MKTGLVEQPGYFYEYVFKANTFFCQSKNVKFKVSVACILAINIFSVSLLVLFPFPIYVLLLDLENTIQR